MTGSHYRIIALAAVMIFTILAGIALFNGIQSSFEKTEFQKCMAKFDLTYSGSNLNAMAERRAYCLMLTKPVSYNGRFPDDSVYTIRLRRQRRPDFPRLIYARF